MISVTAVGRIRAESEREPNVGGGERVARAVVGTTLIVLGGSGLAGLVAPLPGTAGMALSAVLVLAGARMTWTAITRWCYLNALLGRSSCAVGGDATDTPDGSP